MKQQLCLLIVLVMSFNLWAEDLWVSDEIEAPLRASPKLNAKIVDLLKAGQRVQSLEKSKDYVKIKTADGKKGWLSNYYLLKQQSIHEQFEPIKKALAEAEAKVSKLQTEVTQKNVRLTQLQSDFDSSKKKTNAASSRAKARETGFAQLTTNNKILQKQLREQSDKLKQLATVLDSAKQTASDAKTRYLSLVKVSENAVAIDKQNRNLQKKSIEFEQQLQQVKTENQSLKTQMSKKEFLMGALTIFGGALLGYILSIMTPPRGSRRSFFSKRYPSSL